jgi:hypothetical protein
MLVREGATRKKIVPLREEGIARRGFDSFGRNRIKNDPE